LRPFKASRDFVWHEKDWEIWDKQIKKDSNSGKLDFLAKEAMQEENFP